MNRWREVYVLYRICNFGLNNPTILGVFEDAETAERFVDFWEESIPSYLNPKDFHFFIDKTMFQEKVGDKEDATKKV